MKLLISISMFMGWASFATATTSDCADLSFSTNQGLVEWRQISCEKFKIVIFDFEGNVIGEKDTLFSDEFVEENVDDELERYKSRQRWMWSRDRKILIHEATFDKFMKQTSERVFNSLSETISVDSNNRIQRSKSQVLRVEQEDGNVKIETKEDSRVFERL
jgi:hypothetical protein